MTVIQQLSKRLQRLEKESRDPATEQAAEQETRTLMLDHIRSTLEYLGTPDKPVPENGTLAELVYFGINLHFDALREYARRLSRGGPSNFRP
jgi:hypothetical protein